MMMLKSSRLPLAFLGCALLCLIFQARAQNSQSAIPVPQLDPGTVGQPSFRFAGGVPAVVHLIPHGNGARNGHVWVGNTGQSIRIVGEVDGEAPDWPKDRPSFLSKDHVEVWLAGVSDVKMPPIGWGDQFGEQQLDDLKRCSDLHSYQGPEHNAEAQQNCRDWFETQQEYRAIARRLFLRQWLLAENLSVESYATPAYGIISTKYAGDDLAILKPQGDVRFHAEQRSGKPGYIFEVDIPYSSFPPINTLQLSELRVMVDVFRAAPPGRREGPFSTTSAARADGKPDTFNVLRLDPPRVFELSPCGSKLEGTDAYGKVHAAWFIPKVTSGDSYQADAFLIVNEAHGYQYEPEETVSPTVRPIHFFWHKIGTAEWACGPALTYRGGNTIREYGGEVSQEGFEARRTPDGRILIKEGPWVWHSEFGSGQCGACPRMKLKVMTLDSNLNLITLLDLEDRIGGPPEPSSGDITVSPDWSQVEKFEQTGPDKEHLTWSSVMFCLKSGRYTECGRKVGVKPPDPPVIRQKLEQN